MSSSVTLTLSGESSQLSAQYCPAIDLNDSGGGEYVCGLVDFQTFNSIPNIDDTNNLFYFGYEYDDDTIGNNNNRNIDRDENSITDSEIEDNTIPSVALVESDIHRRGELRKRKAIGFNKSEQDSSSSSNRQLPPPTLPLTRIQIPTGSYELTHLNQYLKTRLRQVNESIKLELYANNNTLQCEIFCNQPVDFSKPNTIGSLLGFRNDQILEAYRWYESQLPANILKVNVIRIQCNIIRGPYLNNQPSHSIHEFSPRVPPGYKIIEVPQNVIYFPITVKSIQKIDISIVDQNNQPIDFRGETITVRLHIKKVNH